MAVDKSDNRVRQMFGAIAPSYDRMNHLLSLQRGSLLALAHGASRAAGGSRADPGRLHGHRRPGVRLRPPDTRGEVSIVATDFCPEMLDIGRTKSQRIGLARP